MDDHIAVILHDPLALVVAIDPLALRPRLLELLVDLLGDGQHLASACAGRQNEKIKNGGDGGQIKDQRVVRLEVIGNLGTSTGLQQTLADRRGPILR